ncbi:MAG TPA: CoA transferase [Alphaproteobacteria bacterium]|nr:CoA transferase [Alphaproteobacteria bacterium]
MKHILDGVRVLDITQFLAGPAATRLLAEMGAEVIKIEFPGGDPSRLFPFLKDGRSAYFVQQNRGKKAICLDPKSPEGLEILKGLLAKCDVFIENFAPGVIGRLGLGWDEVKAINPNIVMCSISAFGQTGPLAALPGFDNIGQAYAGVTSMIGETGKTPVFPQLALGDIGTGVHAAAAIGFALFHRERGGGGQYVEVSLLDTYFHHHDANVQVWSLSKGEIKPTRSGSHFYATAPAGIFQGKEMPIVILPLLNMWPKFCEVIGRPDLIHHPRYSDNSRRAENRHELIEIIEGWLQAQESDVESIRILEENRLPVAPILSVEQACQHPHLIERETVRWIDDRVLGRFQIPGMPLRFSAFPGHLDLDAPFLGEHNAAVLGEYLGYSKDRIATLQAMGVLVSEPIPSRAAG